MQKIQLASKLECTGCGACSNACSRHCITMKEDFYGFAIPHINHEICMNCGACVRSCPVLQYIPKSSVENVSYAVINKDENIRLKSASGGFFYAAASYVLKLGGVVFGVKWDNTSAVYDYTETIDGLQAFQGSKYVQAKVGDAYGIVRDFLSQGRMVLFTGTPCQIAGLSQFLRHDCDNLFTLSLICHGISNTKILNHYLEHKYPDLKSCTNIVLRDKRQGWCPYFVSFKGKNKYGDDYEIVENVFDNEFMMAYLFTDLISRESCYHCQFKLDNNSSDLIIGDYWGVNDLHPDLYDNKGTSLVVPMTKKGCEILSWLDDDSVLKRSVSLSDAVKYNPQLVYGIKKPKYRRRERFFLLLNANLSLPLHEYYKDWLLIRLLRFSRKLFKKIWKK